MHQTIIQNDYLKGRSEGQIDLLINSLLEHCIYSNVSIP